ncbi:MAG: hypothetical protein GX651_03350 [Methanomicrobiales archaeon]|nr:hypothetical protein [Methanomicrobiales archaeon]
MKIPVTTMDQSDPILAGDYVIYTECSHPGKDTGRRTCESRIFDIRKEKILEFASSENVQISKDFEYPRKIDGFSKGIFLIEEIRNGEREFGLYRINNLPQTGIPVIPTKVGQETIRENKPAAEKPGPSGSSTPSLPGFAIILPILAFSLVAITRHFRFL